VFRPSLQCDTIHLIALPSLAKEKRVTNRKLSAESKWEVDMQKRQTRKGTTAQQKAQHDTEDEHPWKKREPIVVGDQHGIVIAWPDKHTSRFLWADLRQACPCVKCQNKQEISTSAASIFKTTVSERPKTSHSVGPLNNGKEREGTKEDENTGRGLS
jgi:Gamma-butyrobetaine hydroxylase-like, N-terminal